jgi:hypothetical protein
MDGNLNTTGTDGTGIVFWHRELFPLDADPVRPRLEWRPAHPCSRKLQNEFSFH